MKSLVAIQKIGINEICAGTFHKLFDSIEYRPSKRKIFIKPNIVTDTKAEYGVITHPKVIDALCQYFIRNGVEEIIIGEGSAFFYKAPHFKHLINKCGYEELLNYPEVSLINLEDKSVEREAYKWKYGKLLIPKLIKTHEYINVPTLKTHYQTQVSLGCKNQKGLLLLKDKKNFHRKELHDYISELNKILVPDLTIMDGIFGLEGNGPALNPMSMPVEMDVLLASKDTIALDNVCCKLMDINIIEVNHLPQKEFQIIGMDINKIRKTFKRSQPITYYGNVGEYMCEKACTGCQIANVQMMRKIEFTPELNKTFNMLRSNYNKIYHVFGGNPDMKQISDSDKNKLICFGNCTKDFAEAHELPWIPGCPPEYHKMIEFVINKLKK